MALVSLSVKEAERREHAQLAGLRALGRATNERSVGAGATNECSAGPEEGQELL